MRLDKYVAETLPCTRSQARHLIMGGKVMVGGKLTRDASLHICDADTVSCSGEPLTLEPPPIVMMNKPAGYLTASTDSRQPTVADLLPPRYARLQHIGRLDKDTTGLLLFTADGELSHRILHPKRHLEKVYHATLDNPITDESIAEFERGVALTDFVALPARLSRDESDPLGAFVTVYEGKYHQVRRMFAAQGLTVLKLHRLQVGSVMLDDSLGYGDCRALTAREEQSLREDVGR